jgi:uncharacterized protein YprB with RNaseH-like and TPR domain
MSKDDLKKRIEALNKKPLRNVPHEEPAEMRSLRRKIEKKAAGSDRVGARNLPTHTTAPTPVRTEPIAYRRMPTASGRANLPVSRDGERIVGSLALALEDCICGCAADAPEGPGYYLIELPAKELDGEAVTVHRRLMSLTGHPDAEPVERLACVCGSKRLAPEEIMFLDLETTGLGATTPVFLVGTMECGRDGLHFRQYFARDYSEEISILAAVNKRMKDSRLLVTFNGKSFDAPYLLGRAVATGVKMHMPKAHLDLLHEARAKYKRDLPNCRLQTLEQMVCGRYREEDIPSSEIPAAYHEFVRTGDASKIQSILQHNLYDLLTMADLMNRLWYCE